MGISKEMTANQALRTASQTVKDRQKRNPGNRAGEGNSRYVGQKSSRAAVPVCDAPRRIRFGAPVQVNIQISPPMSDAEFCRVIDGKAASQSEAPIEALPGPRGGRARR